MSWGEKSCEWAHEHRSKMPCSPSYLTCNVDCEHYISNGKTPDSNPQKVRNDRL